MRPLKNRGLSLEGSRKVNGEDLKHKKDYWLEDGGDSVEPLAADSKETGELDNLGSRFSSRASRRERAQPSHHRDFSLVTH